jgi:hypothetical protein
MVKLLDQMPSCATFALFAGFSDDLALAPGGGDGPAVRGQPFRQVVAGNAAACQPSRTKARPLRSAAVAACGKATATITLACKATAGLKAANPCAPGSRQRCALRPPAQSNDGIGSYERDLMVGTTGTEGVFFLRPLATGLETWKA